MTRCQLKKGFQAASWLRERLCTRRYPYMAALAEESVAQSNPPTTKNPFCASNVSTQISRPPFLASNLHSDAKRNLHITEDSISKICKSKFHLTSKEKPSYAGSPRTEYLHLCRQCCLWVHILSQNLFDSTVRIYMVNCSIFGEERFMAGNGASGSMCLLASLLLLKEEWKRHILPPYHPESIRVRRIAKDIIKAVLEGVQEDSYATQLEARGKVHSPKQSDMDVLIRRRNTNFPVSTQWESKEEVLDDQWMDKSRQKGLHQGSKPYVEHLKNTKWEVLIVDKDIVNAFCLPGGKIVVFTGLLRRFPSDKEIATVLGHEVAHVVARHSAERMTRHLYLTLIQLFLLAFLYAPDLVQSLSVLFLELPFSRRQELEADHIGLLLMAAAGYDPRAAPDVYEKLGELGGTSAELLQYVTTHPSGKKRGERLRNTGTMDEAMKIYAEKVQGTVTEGFLRAF